MSVLYSLSYRKGDVMLRGDRIIYSVVEVSSFPYELRQHELHLWSLFFWVIAISLLAMFLVDIISQQHARAASRMPATTKPRTGAEPTQKQAKPE